MRTQVVASTSVAALLTGCLASQVGDPSDGAGAEGGGASSAAEAGFGPAPAEASAGSGGAGVLGPAPGQGGSGQPGVLDEAPSLVGFRFIPDGTFLMGSPAEEPGHIWWDGMDVEKQHAVTLTHSIWMAETEVTQAEWLAVTGSNPSVFSACGPDCPVENVTWFQAVVFCNLRGAQQGLEICYHDPEDGTPYGWDDAAARKPPTWPAGYECRGYRLPTEAEWERAARAGTSSAHFLGAATHENIAESAWYGPNSQCGYAGCEADNCRSGAGGLPPSGPHPVAQRAPNAWGLYDTSGNVWEFVWDIFGEYHDGAVVDPAGPMARAQGYHVARGGSWLNGTAEARSAARDGNDCTCDPDNGPGGHTGFRICRTF